jgi:DNA-binding HxlR family transcriptional regulator
MATKTYGQYCPIAEALDVIGDRWTLLILRELTLGDRRFTDLRSYLPGIAPNLLTDRLRDLESLGLVERRELPPPAARTVYALTADGDRVRPVLSALARFGVDRLAEPDENGPHRPRPASAVYAAITPWHDRLAGSGVHLRLRFVVDGETFDLTEDDGRLSPRLDGHPDLVLSTTAATLFDVRRRGESLRTAVADGRIDVDGPARLVRVVERLFRLAPNEQRVRRNA